ncbi:hypothetical protein Q9R46_01575 [Paenibacillus sp. RRE4]|uniref:hypothetical protein n=1 Tax=Paenibacillus sp. RRE4 TaxID=2962587 RepID=UPI00288191F9|nr:hypothetical protein [Paenibacillus sp. RRE4]MDT0121317.1 hypothetical protein [Paenibacillus sp. RRE4]
MKKSDLFYIWVFISSYLAGVVTYSLSLFLLYNEKTSGWGQLLMWTAPSFFTVTLLLFLLSILLLKCMKKYFLWTQTLLFALVAIVPVYSIPVLSGFWNLTNIAFLFSPEGTLFYLCFFISSLMSSYGVWIAHKRYNNKSFLILSFVAAMIFVIIIAWN